MPSIVDLIPDIADQASKYDVGGSIPLSEKMRSLFARHVREGHEKMVESRQNRDRDQLYWVAHGLKGIGGSCGFEIISAFGDICCKRVKDGTDWEQLDDYVDALGEWISENESELPLAE